MEQLKPTSRRGRPRRDYSQYVGFEGPLGLRIESIIEDGERAREGPHVIAVCARCGERSTPRLRDLLSGHSKSGGCRKKECFLAYCERRVDELDEDTLAGVWEARHQDMSRESTAAHYRLAYPVIDRAQRRFQLKLDRMIEEGKAEQIYRLATQPGWTVESAAGQFDVPSIAGSYLFFAAYNRMKTARAGLTVASPDGPRSLTQAGPELLTFDHDETWWCAFLSSVTVGQVEKRAGDWSVARPGELASSELRRSRGKLVGSFAELYRQGKALLADSELKLAYREDIQRFVDLADTTLKNRSARRLRMAREKVAGKRSDNPDPAYVGSLRES